MHEAIGSASGNALVTSEGVDAVVEDGGDTASVCEADRGRIGIGLP
jgi:hypothetical protein